MGLQRTVPKCQTRGYVVAILKTYLQEKKTSKGMLHVYVKYDRHPYNLGLSIVKYKRPALFGRS